MEGDKIRPEVRERVVEGHTEVAQEVQQGSTQHPSDLSTTCKHDVQSFELIIGGSNNHLTFTKSNIRSDEEHLLDVTGNRNTVRLSVLLLVLLASVIGVILLIVFWTSSHEAPFDYAMVFDAGSTHTEMVIYKWQANKFKGTGVVSQVLSCDMKGGIGVVLRRDPAATASAYFDECLGQGLGSIPTDRRGHSPVFLAATAGMRSVQSESPVEAQQILGNVSRVLERRAGGVDGLLFGVGSVRVISGQEEAVAGWISANYLLKTIFPKPTRLVGMLDMGGASTQITFVRSAAAPASVFDTSLQLYGARHELYARSYMCFGQEQLLKRYLVLLVEDQRLAAAAAAATQSVSSPCHHVGYNQTLRFEEVVNVCSETQNSTRWGKFPVTIVGSSDPEKCRRWIATLLDVDHCQSTFKSQDCFSKPTPHSSEVDFVAVSGFYYVMFYLGLADKESSSISDFLSAIETRCRMTWGEITSISDVPVKYSSVVCFNAQYQAQLLIDGYGIQDKTWKNINFLRKVNGTSVGWTLGFTIRSTNAFPDEPAEEPFSTLTLLLVMFSFAVCIGICFTLGVILLIRGNWFKRNQISVK